MKFAVNYSTPLSELIEQKEIKVDLLKCPEWEGLIQTARLWGPVYIHFDISLGNNRVNSLDFDLIRRLLETTDTPYLNTHLANRLGVDSASELLATWKEDLDFLRGKLPGVRIIAENLPSHEFLPQLKLAADPELISEMIEECDLGLLLDLSHAQISAALLDIDFKDYISRLPLHRLTELHITGIREYGGFLTDHFEMQPHDWSVAQWAAEQIRSAVWQEPEIVAFEYGGVGDVFCWRTERDALKLQVPLLYEIFHTSA